MEIKLDSQGFTIFNHNCDIPPIETPEHPGQSSYLPDLANSITVDHVDDNLTTILDEYFISLLENTISVQTNNGEKSVNIDFVFSPRNDTNYIKKIILKKYTCFTLGFDMTFMNQINDINKIDEVALNLIFQFKQKDIISTYNWFIEYDMVNKEKAKLVLGIKPKDYNSTKYKEENEKIINGKRIKKDINWDIEMNEVYIQDINNSSNTKEKIEYFKCSLEPTLGVIIGTSRYKLFLEEFLFGPLMEEGKCFKSEFILKDYYFYYCKKETKDILKKSKYSTIYFLHRYFGKIFELNYNDIFEENDDYIYLKVFFNKEKVEVWRLGKPFLSKYFFSYDLDGRTISFYDNESRSSGSSSDDKNNSGNRTLLIIVIIVLVLICFAIGFFIAKYIYISKKKQKGNELVDNDNYDYDNINPN
jgi:hypothetical protein